MTEETSDSTCTTVPMLDLPIGIAMCEIERMLGIRLYAAASACSPDGDEDESATDD